MYYLKGEMNRSGHRVLTMALIIPCIRPCSGTSVKKTISTFQPNHYKTDAQTIRITNVQVKFSPMSRRVILFMPDV